MREMREAGVGTSKGTSGGQGGKPEAAEIVSKLRLSDKGKGWEVVEEEVLQEELEQQDVYTEST